MICNIFILWFELLPAPSYLLILLKPPTPPFLVPMQTSKIQIKYSKPAEVSTAASDLHLTAPRPVIKPLKTTGARRPCVRAALICCQTADWLIDESSDHYSTTTDPSWRAEALNPNSVKAIDFRYSRFQAWVAGRTFQKRNWRSKCEAPILANPCPSAK